MTTRKKYVRTAPKHDELVKLPGAKKVARAIAEEAWIAPFNVVSDAMLRRLGAMLQLQELRVRLGLQEEPER